VAVGEKRVQTKEKHKLRLTSKAYKLRLTTKAYKLRLTTKAYKLIQTTKAYKLSYNYINYTINLDGRSFGRWGRSRLRSGSSKRVTLTKMYWLLGRKLQLSLNNKLTSVENHPQTDLYLWYRTLGHGFQHPSSRSWNAFNRKPCAL
jgi:hypothetical protein